MEAKAYYVEQPEDGGYSFLKGPDGFECFLGEPEDCTWHRDGSAAVVRLNQQHEALAALLARHARAIEALRGCVEGMILAAGASGPSCPGCGYEVCKPGCTWENYLAAARAVLEEEKV